MHFYNSRVFRRDLLLVPSYAGVVTQVMTRQCSRVDDTGVFSDFWSWRALEVVRSLQGDWQDSLFGALRHTRTPAGTRKLRATLLQVSLLSCMCSLTQTSFSIHLVSLQLFISNVLSLSQHVNMNYFPHATLPPLPPHCPWDVAQVTHSLLPLYFSQPFSDTRTINARLDSLQYLAQHPDLFHTLQVYFYTCLNGPLLCHTPHKPSTLLWLIHTFLSFIHFNFLHSQTHVMSALSHLSTTSPSRL